jgi:hypothetical protein
MLNESNDYHGISSSHSSNQTKTGCTSSNDDKKLDNVRVIKVSKIAKPSEGRNQSIQLANQQTIDQSLSTIQHLTQPTFSDVTVCRVNRLSERANDRTKADLSQLDKPNDDFAPDPHTNVSKLTKKQNINV